jgi:quercetin dioxygenase-like cupin family protein
LRTAGSRFPAVLKPLPAASHPAAVIRAAGEVALGRRPSAQTFLARRERRNRIDRSGKGGGMRRVLGWALVSVGLAGVITAMTLTPGVATPPSGLTNVPLARGSNTSDGTIPLKVGSDVALAQITVSPCGSSGWHSHPGGAIVVVQQGSLTLHKAVDDGCLTRTYTAGQAFVERPGEVDQVINTGTVPYVLFVTFPRVPAGESARTDEPDPGTCPGL